MKQPLLGEKGRGGNLGEQGVDHLWKTWKERVEGGILKVEGTARFSAELE